MRIGFIRHGETAWNARGLLQGLTDVPLNERGRDQARGAAKLLVGAGWDRIYSSPLGRAFETAETIAAAVGLDRPGLLDGFVEREFGVMEGEPYWTPDGGRANLDDPSVESVEALRERAVAAFDALAERHPTGSTLVVGHGTIIRVLLQEFLTIEAPHMANLALSIVERDDAGDRDDTGWRVTLANGYPLPPSAWRVRPADHAVPMEP